MAVNLKKIEGYVPKSVYEQLPYIVEKYEFNSNGRLAHFLAQCEHESGKFQFVRENLNYSIKGLRGVFPKYFPNNDIAAEYARKPEKIGSRVYANRMGNGDEESGDGYKYRGRGYIQITGKNNYRKFGDYINIDLVENPDLIAIEYPLESAGWYFMTRRLNEIADQGITNDVVRMITKRINGGYNGIDQRIHFFKKFYDLLSR